MLARAWSDSRGLRVPHLAAALVAGTLLCAACGRGSPGSGNGEVAGAADTATAPDRMPPLPAPPEAADSIYVDLTLHDWYAHGEPLRFEGRAYRAHGDPVAAAASEMQRLGSYLGVAFYARNGESRDSAVYVPVTRRYWLRFEAES